MSFWNTSDSKPVEASGKFDSGGGNMAPIPDETTVLAAPVEAGWKNYEGEDYVNIQWQILAPAEYKNRRIFQKIKVYQTDISKADKAKRMLAAIDTNAGGKLMSIEREPSDAELTQFLVGKQMLLKLGVWEINDKTGNWVMAVSPKQTISSNVAPAAQVINNADVPF